MNYWERQRVPNERNSQRLTYHSQRRRRAAIHNDNDMAEAEWLSVYCLKDWCGDPVAFSRKLHKRAMTFVGDDWLGDAVFLCTECGGTRTFGLTLARTIKETTQD